MLAEFVLDNLRYLVLKNGRAMRNFVVRRGIKRPPGRDHIISLLHAAERLCAGNLQVPGSKCTRSSGIAMTPTRAESAPRSASDVSREARSTESAIERKRNGHRPPPGTVTRRAWALRWSRAEAP